MKTVKEVVGKYRKGAIRDLQRGTCLVPDGVTAFARELLDAVKEEMDSFGYYENKDLTGLVRAKLDEIIKSL